MAKAGSTTVGCIQFRILDNWPLSASSFIGEGELWSRWCWWWWSCCCCAWCRWWWCSSGKSNIKVTRTSQESTNRRSRVTGETVTPKTWTVINFLLSLSQQTRLKGMKRPLRDDYSCISVSHALDTIRESLAPKYYDIVFDDHVRRTPSTQSLQTNKKFSSLNKLCQRFVAFNAAFL